LTVTQGVPAGSQTVTVVYIPSGYAPVKPRPTVTGTVFETVVDPVKLTLSFTPPTTKASVPVHGPLPTGLKVTLIAQFALAATLVPHELLLIAKSPLIVGVEIATALALALLTVTDSGVLVVPTATPEN